MRSTAIVVLAGALGLACSRTATPPGPAEVLADFIQTMKQVHGDPLIGTHAVELLWKPARENLNERARRATALSGRVMTPGEMLAPSCFSMHLVPERYETRLEGNWAEIVAIAGDGERKNARAVLENGRWKVALELPPLSPIRQRPTDPDEED